MRVGLLGLEAIAAVYPGKPLAQTQPGDEVTAEALRLVGQDGHGQPGSAPGCECLSHACVENRVVQHVLAVIPQEECQAPVHLFVGSTGPERPANQHVGPVANVRGYDRGWQRRQAGIRASGVHGLRQVLRGVN